MNADRLIEKAIEARKMSYSPYSKYRVGAALLTLDGTIYYGTNIENCSYGLTICVERSAVFSAISNGVRPNQFEALAVVTADGGTSCGACRQVLAEFNLYMPVYFCAFIDPNTASQDGDIISIKTTTVKDMLPDRFRL